jgi:2-oxoglutarate dehydrogenase E2 component (dihydrolipoamide succinyltransferase)
MPVEIRVPAVGESITEVQIGAWLKAAGELVRQDEAVVSLETDKATIELPAPASGRLAPPLKKPGEVARVGEVIGYLEEAPEAATPEAAPARLPVAVSTTPAAAPPTAERRVMPAAGRLLAEPGLAPEAVPATGPGGRLLKEDVLRHVEAEPAAAEVAAAPPAPAAVHGTGGREEEVVPMSMLRRRVAERLVQAQQTAALLTTFNEIDMTAVVALRRAHQDAFRERYRVKLGLMSFFVKAAVEALKLVPEVNAEIRGTDIVYRSYYDIGVAVGGGKGLVVPVLRNAERLGFAEIEAAIADFANRARAGTLTLEELRGGTFTLSNGGIYGSLLSTPIVNPPQSGILGLHVIQDRPVAREGQVVIRPMMYVALTYDHRLVDGREAVTFLKHVKACIEEPARILLEL